jgi:hypothetical protein
VIEPFGAVFANEFYQDAANEFDICDVRGRFCF